ncbi:MAG: serine protease [Clostridia bacterium]|nr:serine protease [Clostridia bacterium]
MNKSDLYTKFDTAYKNAKHWVNLNDAKAARNYIIACMSIMLEFYKGTNISIERAKLYARICEFKNISAMLFETGITEEVKTWFGIVDNKNITQKADIVFDETIDWAADIFAKYIDSAVVVTAKSGATGMNGTGFIISEKGYLLTNDHVVFDENRCDYYKNITMSLYKKKSPIPIDVINSDKKSDVALCKFDTSFIREITPVKRIQDYSKLLPGASVLVIGNGLSMGLAPFTGNVKFPHDDEGNLVSTVPSNHGDSGGPVFNRKGECVGINKSVTVSVTRGTNTMEANGITNATPMDKIEELLAKWCKQYGIEL